MDAVVRKPVEPFSDFPLHRPELLPALHQGDAILKKAMSEKFVRFRKGEEIIRTGEPCDRMYRLESGWTARTRLLDDGRRSILTIFLPGDIFGVKSLLLREQPDSIIALTDTKALAMGHDKLRQLFDTHPSVALRIAFQLGEDERRLHNYVIGLGRANATERIATLLIELRGRLVRAGLCRDDKFNCPLTQQEMGDFLGLTVVHVNRVLRRLHAEGLASVSRGLVQINDLPSLHNLAQPVLDIFERSQPEFGGAAQPARFSP